MSYSLTDTWDTNFQSSPLGSDSPAQGDDKIRQTRRAVEERLGREHEGLGSDTNANHGIHSEGSARAYFEDSEPTTRPDGDSFASAALDDGRLWIDSDGGYRLFGYDGANTQFVGITREVVRLSIMGTLTTGTSISVPIVFQRGCTLTKVSARVGTAPTGTSILIDLNQYTTAEAEQGSVFDGETRITIAAGDYHDTKTDFHATYGVLTADEYLTVDIDQVGSTVPGADLCLVIEAIHS